MTHANALLSRTQVAHPNRNTATPTLHISTEGQNARTPLQENGSNRSLRHISQRRLRKPHSLIPHLKKDRNSSSTNAGTARSGSRCLARNVSSCSVTMWYNRLSSGCRGVISKDAACTSCRSSMSPAKIKSRNRKGVSGPGSTESLAFPHNSSGYFRIFRGLREPFTSHKRQHESWERNSPDSGRLLPRRMAIAIHYFRTANTSMMSRGLIRTVMRESPARPARSSTGRMNLK
jgi:hypothetical protein